MPAQPIHCLPVLSAIASITAFVLVSREVTEPYLDEIFHIPQTQRYCAGDCYSWDPSITTPPGLYLLSAGSLRLLSQPCTPAALRATNLAVLFLITIPLYALLPRSRPRRLAETATIASFPLLFFFANLYYTDVASAAAVLAVYALADRDRHWLAGLAGAASLTIRQTNIVWVGFVLVLALLRRLSVPDPRLVNASLRDVPCAILSAAQSALRRPVIVLRVALPYTPALLGFTAFLVWNGGIVLGHHEHHAAVAHFAQLLYFLAFASVLLFPVFFSTRTIRDAFAYGLSSPRRAAASTAALLLINLVIHCYTIIHPFLLADNRHYVFYVFRRLIAPVPIRHALSPLYLAAAWAWASRMRGAPLLWSLGFAACTSAVLVPTPLVEPRYFLVPTLLLRVQLARADKGHGNVEPDARLWAEWVWYTAINTATTALFLTVKFRWDGWDGWMRFMW
ncbi:hypothetical protein Q5752_005873 [Cryptotrichosporon argae]